MKRKSHNGQGKDESVVMIRRRALAKIGVAIGIGKITSGKRKSPNKNATLLMMTVRDLERNIIKSRRKKKIEEARIDSSSRASRDARAHPAPSSTMDVGLHVVSSNKCFAKAGAAGQR